MGLFKTLKNMVTGKIEDINDKIIEDNPELILEQTIKEQEERYLENEEKASEMKSQLIQHKKETAKLRDNLIKIQQRISIAQRDGNAEEVALGNQLYKQREKELIERLDIEKEIEEAVSEILDFLKESKEEIRRLESEKASLIAKLNSANMKEEIMNLKSTINRGNTNSFATARNTINKRIDKINSRNSIRETTSETKGSKYFNGL